MNLLDPQRPHLNSRPQLECGNVAPPLEVMPCGDEQVEISAWLPVAGNRFEAKRFVTRVDMAELPAITAEYYMDPENALERLFASAEPGQLKLDVRSRRARAEPSAARTVTASEIEI